MIRMHRFDLPWGTNEEVKLNCAGSSQHSPATITRHSLSEVWLLEYELSGDDSGSSKDFLVVYSVA